MLMYFYFQFSSMSLKTDHRTSFSLIHDKEQEDIQNSLKWKKRFFNYLFWFKLTGVYM